MGFIPQNTFTQHDEARYVQNSIGIQIMELNSICEKESAEEFVRRKGKTTEDKGEKEYPESRGWPGMISGPPMRISAGSSFTMHVFVVFCRSCSRNLVWLQLPTLGASESMALVFLFTLFAVSVAVLVVEEPLLPMAAALG
jgi:hypothetical protein